MVACISEENGMKERKKCLTIAGSESQKYFYKKAICGGCNK
jgi:hypothetical protein